MTGKTIVILGGGFGGLTAAQQLRTLLPREHRIVVVEKQSIAYMCSFNMRLMAGESQDAREGERALSSLAHKGIEWLNDEILEFDPKARTVRTSSGRLEADYLIIALGADKDVNSVPGFSESAFNLCDSSGALGVRSALKEFESGKAVVLICRSPFSCPAAPYEAAFLMDSFFRGMGNRPQVEIAVYTPEGRPMAAAGPEMGNAIIEMMKERNIEYHTQQKLQKVVTDSRRIIFDGAEVPFDLLVGIPPHFAPKVVREAGLTDETGWIPVTLDTLETDYSGVFAIGDVTSIRQPNPSGFFLPKAGAFADEQSRVVAKNIAAQIKGEEKGHRFDGRGFCYIDIGDGMAAYGSGKFYSSPIASVWMEPPSKRLHEERKKLEQDQLESLV